MAKNNKDKEKTSNNSPDVQEENCQKNQTLLKKKIRF